MGLNNNWNIPIVWRDMKNNPLPWELLHIVNQYRLTQQNRNKTIHKFLRMIMKLYVIIHQAVNIRTISQSHRLWYLKIRLEKKASTCGHHIQLWISPLIEFPITRGIWYKTEIRIRFPGGILICSALNLTTSHTPTGKWNLNVVPGFYWTSPD